MQTITVLCLYSAIIIVLFSLGNAVEMSELERGYFELEDPCTSKGGICIRKDLCDLEQTDNDIVGCPKQKDMGAVCCHHLPKNENRCIKLGGDCRDGSECRQKPLAAAQDCLAPEVCCLLT